MNTPAVVFVLCFACCALGCVPSDTQGCLNGVAYDNSTQYACRSMFFDLLFVRVEIT